MRFVNEAGTYYLEEQEQRVELSADEIRLFRQMTPMGRKIALRQLGRGVSSQDPTG